jgi:cobalamin synthase
MSHAPPVPEPRAAPPFRGLGGLAAAFRQLTILGPAGALCRVDASAVYFPLVGLVLGVVWAAVDRAIDPWAGRRAASIGVLVVAAGLTRGRGVLALARTLVAALFGRGRGVEALESTAAGTPWIAAALVLAAELGVLVGLARFRLVGLAFAPVLGCCSMVVLAVGSRAARADGRQLKFAPEVTFREFGIATTATFALLFLTTEFLGLLLVLTTAAFTVAARVGWHRSIGGVNATALLATAEATQLLVLAVLAAMG